MSHLSVKDVNEFFGIWLPLLGYVNKRKQLFPELDTMAIRTKMVPQIASEIAERLWDDVSLIDDYIADNEGLTKEEQDVLQAWKRAKTDNFIFERQLKDGAVFINQDKEVYLVKGTSISFETMFAGRTLPLALTATLIPFKGGIITDGLVGLMNITYGDDLKKEFRDIYNDARKKERIITSL